MTVQRKGNDIKKTEKGAGGNNAGELSSKGTESEKGVAPITSYQMIRLYKGVEYDEIQ